MRCQRAGEHSFCFNCCTRRDAPPTCIIAWMVALRSRLKPDTGANNYITRSSVACGSGCSAWLRARSMSVDGGSVSIAIVFQA